MNFFLFIDKNLAFIIFVDCQVMLSLANLLYSMGTINGNQRPYELRINL